MKKAIYTALVFGLLIGTMLIARHIKTLNNQIEFKQIQLKDNSTQLKLLDSKYDQLNKELDRTGSDKAKVEEQLRQLQIERDKLQADLQAKKEQKAKDLAVRTTQAVGAPQTAYASTGNCEAWMAQAGIPSTEATNKLILKESNCRPHAVNPSSGACGIPQAFPCSKLPCPLNESGAVCQLQWMANYVKNRYGSWENALATWYSRCGSPQGCWY